MDEHWAIYFDGRTCAYGVEKSDRGTYYSRADAVRTARKMTKAIGTPMACCGTQPTAAYNPYREIYEYVCPVCARKAQAKAKIPYWMHGECADEIEAARRRAAQEWNYALNGVEVTAD